LIIFGVEAGIARNAYDEAEKLQRSKNRRRIREVFSTSVEKIFLKKERARE
jgi:hypothetical protein